MKGTFFSTDFIKDSDGNLRLMEVNTDTGCVLNGLPYLDFSSFILLLSSSNITEVHTIHKDFQKEIVNTLSQSLIDSASFISSFTSTLEDAGTIYPTTISDSDTKFVLRFAYDEASIFDSEYAKNVLGPLQLFTENDNTASIVEYAFSSSTYEHQFNNLPLSFNTTNVPDAAVKDVSTTTTAPISFYKIGKSSETDENRWSEFTSSLSDTNLVIKFYEDTTQSKVKSFRSYNIIYGTDLNVLNVGNFVAEGLFDKPTAIEYDDTQIANETNIKHYYELTTNYPKFSNVYNWGGVFEEEEIIKADGTTVLISSASIGDEFKSYFINGAPDTDVVNTFMDWSYPGSELPSGSYETSSVLINKIEQPLLYNLAFHLTMEDGSTFRASGGVHLLVHDTELDCIRYESVGEIDATKHQLINLTGGLINISSVVIEILDGEYNTYIVDMETSDTYFLSNGELSVKIVTHNCFPAGTKITLADGTQKNIEDLTLTDKLLTFNEATGEKTEGAIGNIIKKKEHLLIRHKTDDGNEVKSTALHKFYVKDRGWIPAQDIVLEDILINRDGNETIVVEKENILGEVEVYHILDVKDNHTYYAENLLVHNFKYGGGGGFCFVAGTKVTMVDGSEKNIEDVVIGEEVISFNESTLQNEVKKVIGLKTPIHNDLVKYEFANQTSITSTFDHPFYVGDLELASYTPFLTNKRYELNKEVKQIKVSDMVYLSNGVSRTAIKDIIELDEKDTQTYIITVEDNHNFYANGILVHNK
jgi:intein/homing endonuclease